MKDLAACFKGLADPNRLRIVHLLLRGEMCGCDVQYVLGLSQPNTSRHLTYLKHAGLVANRREGFRVFYRLTPEAARGFSPLFQFLRQVFRKDPTLQQDLRHLQKAVRAGACTLQPETSR